LIINLGSGYLPIKDVVNIDITPNEFVDEVYDFSKLPWKWETESLDGIYMLHSIEHAPNHEEIIKECHRVLKKGGFLYISAPHPTKASNVGCMGHFRTYSYNTLTDYLCREFYMFKKPLFKMEIQEIRWWFYPYNKHPYINYKRKLPIRPPNVNRFLFWCFLKPAELIIQPLINLSPSLFENFWGYWVGGAYEIIWKGIKI
jgi:SAM-dependent methyltransferase